MKSSRKIILIAFAAALFIAVGAPQAALAANAGIEAGVVITNTADVDYEVNGNPQTTIQASVTFWVDNLVNLTVAEGAAAATSVLPGETGAIFVFNVSNTGNTVQDYGLNAAQATTTVFGLTDDIDTTALSVFVESGATAGYQSAEDTALFIDELRPDFASTVYVLASIPATAYDGSVAIISLTATTEVGGTTASEGAVLSETVGPDTPLAVDVVFADGAGSSDAANDGTHSALGAYIVESADLAVTKSSVVISDPVNLGVNPKAIPGATVRYTVLVTNNGSADAGTVVVTDSVPANTTFVPGSINPAGGTFVDPVVTMPVTSPLAPAASDTVGFSVTIN
ncbi:MAG: DUF11 domain-containing protein [bacterium]